MNDFAAFALPPPLAQAIAVLGYERPTPVQEHALPPLLAGRDVVAQARTGTGKTAAFGLALLARVDVGEARTQALVLCPTRELADQVAEEVRRLARFVPNVRVVALCGGVPARTQLPSLQTAPHVVVGTPGRILDHLGRESLDLRALRVLVLDEADRLLDQGFHDAITEIVARTPRARQTTLFSATIPDEVRALSRALQRDPVAITVDVAAPAGDVEQHVVAVDADRKLDALVALLLARRPASTLVFVHTRNDARDVAAALEQRGFAAAALHGEMEQRERDDVLLRFANQSVAVLIATDVAARGLDVDDLAAVVSWELPVDPDVHVHRVGRTGRAGKKGLAVALVAPRERDRLSRIEQRLGARITIGAVDVAAPDARPPPPPMVTIVVDGGKREKLRRGDVLGALTGDVGLPADAIGKIDVLARTTYVAVRRAHADAALAGLRAHKIKGKAFRVRRA
jgi:ATP-dependent RNA helicase DbpA